MRSLFTAAYWGVRKESVDECAVRMSAFLLEIAQLSDAYSGWREQSWTKEEALGGPIVDAHDRDLLRNYLLAGRHRRDTDGSVIEDLGYTIGFWNGGDDLSAVSVSISCGKYTRTKGLKNSVVLGIPGALSESRSLKIELIRSLASSWEPETAIVRSNAISLLDDIEKLRASDALYFDSDASVPKELDCFPREPLGSGILIVPSRPEALSR